MCAAWPPKRPTPFLPLRMIGSDSKENMAMSRLVLFVHGWSVTHTDTYGELPDQEKDRVGHRGRAWRELLARLRDERAISPSG